MEEPRSRRRKKNKWRAASYQTPYSLRSDDSDNMMMADADDVQVRQDRLLVHVLKMNGYDNPFYCRNHTYMFDYFKTVLRPTAQSAHRPTLSTTLSSF